MRGLSRNKTLRWISAAAAGTALAAGSLVFLPATASAETRADTRGDTRADTGQTARLASDGTAEQAECPVTVDCRFVPAAPSNNSGR